MAAILHHLGRMKPYKLPQLVSRISAINSSTKCHPKIIIVQSPKISPQSLKTWITNQAWKELGIWHLKRLKVGFFSAKIERNLTGHSLDPLPKNLDRNFAPTKIDNFLPRDDYLSFLPKFFHSSNLHQQTGTTL